MATVITLCCHHFCTCWTTSY